MHRRGVVVGLIASAIALAVAPTLMPPDYSWITHTTSESAAQGVGGAWLARLGFLGFGMSVVVLAVSRPRGWNRSARASHLSFGMLMAVAAAVSVRPWARGASFDAVEDWLHSFAATAMGFAFAFGVLAVALSHFRMVGQVRGLDIVAIAASVVIPLAMLGLSDQAGVLQRAMFAIALVWYGREAFAPDGAQGMPLAER